VIRTVGPDGLTLSLTEGGTVRAPPGQSIPGARDLVFQEAVRVQTVEYRHRVVDRGIPKVLAGELYLVGVRGTRAILQRDTERAMPPIHSPTALLERRLAAIPIVSVGPGIWEVAAEDVRVAMQSGEAIIAHALQESRLQLSPNVGIGLEVRTPLADVRLDRRGFVITSPNLARRAGLEIGDRILRVNDVPIDGFGALVQAYRRIKSDPSIRVVQLLVERDKMPLSLTYRVR
jgi:membrane-associated protease RseP (regulator of RpoE activity)